MLYSVGYATKALDDFLAQLDTHGITAVADVRSVPFSKRFFDYHQPALNGALNRRGIHYVYLGDELGPRSKDPAHYNDAGQIQFERLQTSSLFQTGIQRLFTGMEKGMNIALLCAEKDPAVCHRSLHIGQYLLDRHQLDTAHLSHTGELEMESALQRRVMQEQNIQPDMLTPECDCLRLAWRAQCQRYAYRRPE